MTKLRAAAFAERPLPTGAPLERLLRLIFKRQLQEILPRLRQGLDRVPRLDHWTPFMVEQTRPLIAKWVKAGGLDSAKRIRRLLGIEGRRRMMWMYGAKREVSKLDAKLFFDVLHPRVQEFIDHWTFVFCDSTNQTSTMLLDDALTKLRQELMQGLQLGEAMTTLAERVQTIFAEPARAVRIARTEASRAVHGGQGLAAKDSGVVIGKRWVAKSDACPICRELAGKQVGLDEDFAVDPGGGTYARVPYPPRHPHC